MEDLRSGRISQNGRVSSSTTSRGWLRVRFPERRVLVIDCGDRASTLSVAQEFASAYCKVAIASSSSLSDLNGSIRKYTLTPDEPSEERRMIRELTKVWRDLDVIVACGETESSFEGIHTFIEEWCSFREASPLKPDYGGRLIFIARDLRNFKLDSELSDRLSNLSVSITLLTFSSSELNPRTPLLLCSPAFNGTQIH